MRSIAMTDGIDNIHKTDSTNQFVDNCFGVHCFRCDQILFSEHTHDFKKCSCEDEHGVFVDGGKSYFRVGAGDLSDFTVVHRNADGILYPDT
jgi:hypothetical protein